MRVITGSARGRRLKTPEGMDIRPTTDNVKESVFNILQFDIEGRRVLDLFAGTGQLGIECLSRGAREVVFIDQSRDAVKIIKENLKTCGFSAPVLQQDALAYLNGCGKFDLILVDPPYDAGLYETVLDKINSFDILSDGGIILCESRRETDPARNARSLPETQGVPLRQGEAQSVQQGEPLMRTAICPGSFDPITLGHLNIIARAAQIFDHVVVCVAANATKTSPMFTVEEKVEMVRRAVAPYANVSVEVNTGLLAEFARRYEGSVLIKGLRAASDFDYEFQMDLINKRINPALETMFLTADQRYTFLSSSIVREMAHYGAELKGLVPDEIIGLIEEKARMRRE